MKMGLKKQKKRNEHTDMELNSEQESLEVNGMETAEAELPPEEQIKQLQQIAYYDTITKLPNMAKFSEDCRKMIQEFPEAFFGVIVFEIENLDKIRILYGLQECDRVRCYVADSMRELLKMGYIYGRIHEDLFAVFANFDEEDELTNLVDLLTNGIREYSNNAKLFFSFGIYKIEDNSKEISEMANLAELAKRTVKSDSAVNYAFYTPELEARLLEDKQMGAEMDYALEHHQFVMFLQPMVNLRTHEIIGAEALVRWDHPEKGILSPFKFIPLFEANNFMIKLDHYIWREAFKTIRHWIDNKIEPIPISINISPIHFEHPRFVETLCNYAEQFRIPKNMIQLEIAERSFSDSKENMKDVLLELNKEGFRLCIDNYGSYQAPLNAIKDYPISVIKMDRLFLNKNLDNEEGLTLVRYIHAMAKELDRDVIAEGVETIEQAGNLSELGCDYAQGFFFAKPMALREFDAFHKKILKDKDIPAITYPTFDEMDNDLLP